MSIFWMIPLAFFGFCTFAGFASIYSGVSSYFRNRRLRRQRFERSMRAAFSGRAPL